MMMKWLSRMEVFGFIATLLAISGVVMNNYKFRWCFVVWVLSNAITALLHWRVRIWSLLARDIVFIILAIAGWFMWS